MLMSSSTNLEATLPQYLERISSLEEEVQVMTAEKASRMVEVETLQGVVKTIASQVRYTGQKMKIEMEEMKLSLVERKEKVLEESLEGRLEKERNLAVIESARSEQSMLRDAVRNLKIEKIRLLKRMDVYTDTKKVPEVAKQEVVGLEDFNNRFILAQQVDNKLRHELDQLISVAMEHQDKLNRTVEQIEKYVEKKCELEMILATDVKIDPEEEEVTETEFKEKNTAAHIGSKKDDQKLNALKEKIKSVEKEIEEKSSTLEEILATVGSLVLADREKMKMEEEEKRKMVEQRKEEIVLEKRNIEIERVEKIAQFKEEKNNLERKELALNISLASLNMDIERSKMMRLGGKGMFLSEDGWEVEDLVLPGQGDEDEQAGDIRESE